MRIVILTLFLMVPALAQHEANPEEGQRLFRENCVICHGPDGTVPGGIDLLKGKFKRPSSDANLIGTIRAGIPNTAMTALSLSPDQAADIVGFMRARAQAPAVTLGDAARGRAIAEGKGQCLTCHRIRGNGSRYAPDLTDVGALRRPDQLQTAILDPDGEVLPVNRIMRAVPKSGSAVNGRILNQDTFTIQLIDAKEQLLSFERSSLKELSVVPKSPMPSVRGKLSAAEVADLTGYLVSLKGN